MCSEYFREGRRLPRALVDELPSAVEGCLWWVTSASSRTRPASSVPWHIYDTDPFVTLDAEGVGGLMRIAAESGRAVRKDLELGICGEHGGDPASIELCDRLGLDYVSCSPSRVPFARLAAAQSALRARERSSAKTIRKPATICGTVTKY